VDEIVGASMEGIARCKTEKDVWGAIEVCCRFCCRDSTDPELRTRLQVISSLHRRFPKTFTPALVSSLSTALSFPSRASLSALTTEQREKEDSTRISRQRPVIRVCSELALVGIIKDAPDRSGGDWIMKALKELVCLLPVLDYVAVFISKCSCPMTRLCRLCLYCQHS
jgi:regulator of nonsense transcripts 2